MNFSVGTLCSIFLFISVLFGCCSCSLLPQPANSPTTYYDLGIPEKVLSSPKGEIHVLPFNSLSGERFRMVRRNGYILINDNDNKWQMPPGSLVTKYLTLTFRDTAKPDLRNRANITLSGSVTAFEADEDEAILGILYRIKYLPENFSSPKWNIERSVLIKEKISGNTPADFAAAMTKALEKTAKMIIKDIDTK